ncbi:hypothetical protein RSAG8_11153, partial [Rhizoctonia solani AG-8 WAC10335]
MKFNTRASTEGDHAIELTNCKADKINREEYEHILLLRPRTGQSSEKQSALVDRRQELRAGDIEFINVNLVKYSYYYSIIFTQSAPYPPRMSQLMLTLRS